MGVPLYILETSGAARVRDACPVAPDRAFATVADLAVGLRQADTICVAIIDASDEFAPAPAELTLECFPGHHVIVVVGVRESTRSTWLDAGALVLTDSSDDDSLAARAIGKAVEHAESVRAWHGRLKGADFLRTLSHDFKNHVNGILGFSELILADGELAPTTVEDLEQIRGNAHALLSECKRLDEEVRAMRATNHEPSF